MSVAEELKILVKTEVDKARRDFQHMREDTTNLKNEFKNLAGTLVGVGSVTAGLAVLKRVVVDNVREGVRFAAQLEKQATAFEVLLKSSSGAERLMKEIQAFSAVTPYMVDQLTDVAQVLVATGTEASEVTRVLNNLGNAAMGDSEKLSRLADAYSKLQTKGRASLEEINRFTEAGVPLLDALQTQYGLTREELFKYISAGKVGFAEVNTALQSMTEGEGAFAGMLEKQSETLSGVTSTYRGEIELLRAAFVDDLMPSLTTAVGEMTNMVRLIREAKEEAGLASNFRTNFARTQADSFASLSLAERKKLLEDTIAGYEPAKQQTTALFAGLAGTQAALAERSALTQLDSDLALLRRMLEGVELEMRYGGAIGEAMNKISNLIGSMPGAESGKNFLLPGQREEFTNTAADIRSQLMNALGFDDIKAFNEANPEFFNLAKMAWLAPEAQKANIGMPSQFNTGAYGFANLFPGYSQGNIDLNIARAISQYQTSPFNYDSYTAPGIQPSLRRLGTFPQTPNSEAMYAAGGGVFGLTGNDFNDRYNKYMEIIRASKEVSQAGRSPLAGYRGEGMSPAMFAAGEALDSMFSNATRQEIVNMRTETDKLADSLDAVGASLVSAFGSNAAKAAIDAAFEFGKALANGEISAAKFDDIIGDFGQTLLSMLPQLLLSAAATAAMTPGGLPTAALLLAAAAGTSVVSGIVSGVRENNSAVTSNTGSNRSVNVTNIYNGDILTEDRLDNRIARVYYGIGSPA